MKIKLTYLLTFFLVFCMQFTFSQEKSIKGKITDTNGVPLGGVTIVVEGSNRGVASNFDGDYTILAKTV